MLALSSGKLCPAVHHGRMLSDICLEPTCQKRGVVCKRCIEEHHNGHQLCTISELVGHIAEERNHHRAIQQRVRADLASLSLAKASHIALLRGVRAQIDRKLNEAEVLIAARFDLLESRVQKEARLSYEVEHISIPSTSISMEQYLQEFKIAADQFVRTQAARNHLAHNILRSVKGAADLLDKMEKLLVDSVRNISEAIKLVDLIQDSFTTEPRSTEPKSIERGLQWSPTLKHFDIAISGKEAWRKQHSCDYAIGVLLQEGLSTGPSLKHSWSVRVLRKQGTIMLGICQAASAIGSQFIDRELAHSNSHGHYLISGTRVYSHHDNHLNHKQMYFPISEGDTLCIEYDKTTNTLAFQNSLGDKYRLEIQQPSHHESYHGCVYLSTVGDSVEIVTHCL